MDTYLPPPTPAVPGGIVPPPSSPPPAELEELNEAQLREIYEDEEIERFLHLFSRYVDEAKSQEAPETPTRASTLADPTDHGGKGACYNNDPKLQTTPRGHPSYKNYISEEVAYHLLLPRLPALRSSYQEFTFNRLRLAAQRLYPATVPHYLPFIKRLSLLAKWENRKESLAFCAGFWFFWWQDLLLAAFFFILLLVLLKHRFFPYPSLVELKRYREGVYHADQLGEQLSQRFSATSGFRIRDAWRFGKLLAFPTQAKTPLRENGSHPRSANPPSHETPDEPESTADSEEVQELKRLVLFLANEIADFHERVKNLFIWRKPVSSWLYCRLLTVLFLVALLVPAKYILKTTFGAAGFTFWHITPVIAALPSKDRLRLPPPLPDVPTDTEYAMEIISRRVAAGLEIQPSKFAKARSSRAVPSPGVSSAESGPLRPKHQPNSKSKDMSERWKQVGNTIDSGKFLLREGKRLLSNAQMNQPGGPSTETLGPSTPTPPIPVLNTHTFPAQHSSSPGLITFTPTTLYFTPLTALYPTLTIATSMIKGVKKNGVLKGLNIVWTKTDSEGQGVEKLEKFIWIGNRDDLFARIISANAHIR